MGSVYLEELIVYLIYFLEQFLMVYLFVKDCRRRSDFPKRMAVLLCVGISVQFPIAALRLIENFPFLSAVKFSLSLAPLFLFLLCYQISLKTLVFDMLFSAAVRQWTKIALTIVLFFFPEMSFFVQRIVNLVSYCLLLPVVYSLFVRPFSRSDEIALDWISLSLLGVVFYLIETVPFLLLQIYQSEEMGIAVCASRIIVELVVIWLYLYVCKKSKTKEEQLISDALLSKERQQYEALKLYIEGIQDRLHDLKYLLRTVEATRSDGADLKALGDFVRNVGSSYHTGNEILDIILTDANNKFAENGIEFSCMLAQPFPDLLKDFDLFSLLGNAFDNAAEYLSGCDREKRYVSFTAKKINGTFLYCEIANYYEGQGDVFVGMRSSKKDDFLHGYGMKNMKRIAEQYRGNFHVGVREGEFYVSITVPLF